MQMDDMIIISVDDHAIEPPGAFTRHYTDQYKSEAPRIERRGQTDVWVWNDTVYPSGGLNAVVGRPRSEYGMEPTGFDQMREGCYDVKKRVEDMNVNGILGSLNFGTFPGFSGKVFIEAAKSKPDVALRALRAYNDWHMADWVGAAPERFIPMAMLPVWDMDATLAEMKRMSDLGVHAVSFSDNPYLLGLPSIHNGYWEPLWKACCDYEMVLNCHIGTGAGAAHASDESPIDAWITTMPMSIANSAADWMFGSFWERHPTLKMALSEGSIGWVPYLLERADHTYEHQHEWTHTNFGDRKPSDIFKKHIITCFIVDTFGLDNLKYMNEDLITYEVDYPHSDTLWPNCPEYLWDNVKNLGKETIDKVTHVNMMREYKWNPFEAMGGRENCTVGALRKLSPGVDVSPRANMGGLSADKGSGAIVTSGDIQRMFQRGDVEAENKVVG